MLNTTLKIAFAIRDFIAVITMDTISIVVAFLTMLNIALRKTLAFGNFKTVFTVDTITVRSALLTMSNIALRNTVTIDQFKAVFTMDTIMVIVGTFLAMWDMTFWKIRDDTDDIEDLSNILRTNQNGCHFAHNIIICFQMNKNIRISIQISMKFVPTGPIDNKSASVLKKLQFQCHLRYCSSQQVDVSPNHTALFTILVLIMAWRWTCDRQLSEPTVAYLPTNIFISITLPRWPKRFFDQSMWSEMCSEIRLWCDVYFLMKNIYIVFLSFSTWTVYHYNVVIVNNSCM